MSLLELKPYPSADLFFWGEKRFYHSSSLDAMKARDCKCVSVCVCLCVSVCVRCSKHDIFCSDSFSQVLQKTNHVQF